MVGGVSPILYVVAVIVVIVLLLLLYLLLTRGRCRHEWRRVYSETMWDSNVRVIVYQCTKCGKIRREYRPT